MTCQSTCPTICASPAQPAAAAGWRPSTLAARTAALVRKGWRAYWEWRARKATVMILRSLDARTLRDIGIGPSEIEWLVQTGGDHRRRYDAAWLWRSDDFSASRSR